MPTQSGSYDVHSAARGPHWIAWVSRPGSQEPERSIVLIGANKEEAEARARAWADGTYNSELGIRN